MATAMRTLVLVKHSLPEIEEDLPSASWRLSDEGRRRCASLGRALEGRELSLVLSSQEPKAMETAKLCAESLGVDWATAEEIHEHERPVAGLLSPHEYGTRMERLFAHPDELVFGTETAAQAEARFDRAVMRILARHLHGNLAVVCHGTVISLFVSRHAGTDAFSLWRRLGLPSFVVCSVPDLDLLEVVGSLG